MNKIKAFVQHFKVPVSMNKLFDEWLDSKKNLKAQSLRTYTQLVDHYLRPAFGETTVWNMTDAMVQNFIDAMQENYSAKTIHEVYRCLKAAFVLAAEREMIERNPCERVVLPTKEKTEAKVLTANEQEKLNKALEESLQPLDMALLLALRLGLRLSEVVALRWQDVRFREKTVVIKHSMERVAAGAGNKTKAHLGTPKTQNSQRKIPLTADFTALLKNYYEQRNTWQKKATAFVVGKEEGTAYHGRTLERYFKKRIAALGFSAVYTFHSLRHSFATRAMESGVAVKVISTLLGHSKTATTTEIYLHLSEHFIREEMMKMTKAPRKKRRYATPKMPPVNAA